MIKRNATADEIKQVFRVRPVKPMLHCPICGNEYQQNRPWQKFCKRECKVAWHEFNKSRKLDNASET